MVVGLDVVDNRRRNVLQRSLRVARHEFLALDEYLLHLFAVDGYLAVVADTGTGQTLHEFFYRRTFGRAIGRGIIDERVFFQRHLGCLTGYGRPLQHHGIGPHHDRAQVHVFPIDDIDLTQQRLIADAGDSDEIKPVVGRLHRELSVVVGNRSRNERTVTGAKQLHRGLWQSFFTVSVRKKSADKPALREAASARNGHQQD